MVHIKKKKKGTESKELAQGQTIRDGRKVKVLVT